MKISGTFNDIRTKPEALSYIIYACFRQFGFAPNKNQIHLLTFSDKRIVFNVGGKKYSITKYNDIPIVTILNSYN